jgi:hypothetical protein
MTKAIYIDQLQDALSLTLEGIPILEVTHYITGKLNGEFASEYSHDLEASLLRAFENDDVPAAKIVIHRIAIRVIEAVISDPGIGLDLRAICNGIHPKANPNKDTRAQTNGEEARTAADIRPARTKVQKFQVPYKRKEQDTATKTTTSSRTHVAGNLHNPKLPPKSDDVNAKRQRLHNPNPPLTTTGSVRTSVSQHRTYEKGVHASTRPPLHTLHARQTSTAPPADRAARVPQQESISPSDVDVSVPAPHARQKVSKQTSTAPPADRAARVPQQESISPSDVDVSVPTARAHSRILDPDGTSAIGPQSAGGPVDPADEAPTTERSASPLDDELEEVAEEIIEEEIEEEVISEEYIVEEEEDELIDGNGDSGNRKRAPAPPLFSLYDHHKREVSIQQPDVEMRTSLAHIPKTTFPTTHVEHVTADVSETDTARILAETRLLHLVMPQEDSIKLQSIINKRIDEWVAGGRRLVPVAEVRLENNSYKLLGVNINHDQFFDDRRFLKHHHSDFTTVRIAGCSVLDMANISAMSNDTQWNHTVLMKALQHRPSCTNIDKWAKEKNKCMKDRSDTCTCACCYVNELGDEFVKAFAMYILGNICGIDEDTEDDDGDGTELKSRCVFPTLTELAVPAEIRDCTGLWLQAPLRRPTETSKKVHVSHIIAKALGVEVNECTSKGLPMNLEKTCGRRYCVNVEHFVHSRRFCANTRAGMVAVLRAANYSEEDIERYLVRE